MVKPILFGAFLLLAGPQLVPRTPPRGSAINFFAPQQDIEIGADSAAQAEHQVTFVRDPGINRYVRTIGQRLIHNDALPKVDYQFRIVNSREITSLGFPNGSVYIYRGLLELASNDDEVAALLAHEVAHIGSRHATVQLSRQLLVQAPISIASGLTTEDGWKDQLTKLGVVFGVHASFLRYSEDQEIEATIMAARLMNDAHFDPHSLAAILKKAADLGRAQDADFVFDHPSFAGQAMPLQAEIESLSPTRYPAHATADFKAFHDALTKLRAVPTVETSVADIPNDLVPKIYSHPLDYYRLRYPEGWQVLTTGPDGAIIAPVDGVQRTRALGEDVTHGVMVDLFDLTSSDRPLTLEQGTNRLIASLRQRNPCGDPRCEPLRAVPGAQSPTLIHDEPGLLTILLGKDVTGDPYVAWVVTRMFDKNLFYLLLVAPEDEFATYQPIFRQIIQSVELR